MSKSSHDNLALGRGKRPKLNNETVAMRMSPETKAALEAIADSYGCSYGGKPWIAGLLAKVAQDELIIVPAPPPRNSQQNFTNTGDSTDATAAIESHDHRVVVAKPIQDKCATYSSPEPDAH
ncbi:MAG: hypothetical protein ACO3EZ_11655 [Prochlorotrichaceae cyanobacterium]